MQTAHKHILSQLQPFNEARFDACMGYLGGVNHRDLTQYEMIKLHVMIDLLHIAAHGQPVIGGKLAAWQYGPVIDPAYSRVKHWVGAFDKDGVQPEDFDIVRKNGNVLYFKPSSDVSPDEFSKSELAAMNQAWRIVMKEHADWRQSQDYFHNPRLPLGKVWSQARERRTGMDWRDLVRAWGEYRGMDLSHIVNLIEN